MVYFKIIHVFDGLQNMDRSFSFDILVPLHCYSLEFSYIVEHLFSDPAIWCLYTYPSEFDTYMPRYYINMFIPSVFLIAKH